MIERSRNVRHGRKSAAERERIGERSGFKNGDIGKERSGSGGGSGSSGSGSGRDRRRTRRSKNDIITT